MTMSPEDMQATLERFDRVQALQTQALRRILEGKLEGATGAAASIVALEGGNTDIDVQLGKS